MPFAKTWGANYVTTCLEGGFCSCEFESHEGSLWGRRVLKFGISRVVYCILEAVTTNRLILWLFYSVRIACQHWLKLHSWFVKTNPTALNVVPWQCDFLCSNVCRAWKMSNLRNNDRPPPFQQPLRTIATSNTIQNLFLREKSKMNSPMSNLAMNLSELSTKGWVRWGQTETMYAAWLSDVYWICLVMFVWRGGYLLISCVYFKYKLLYTA